MLRFLHCADLHLDRSFEGLQLIHENVTHLPEVNERVLENIVTLALAEEVDFVLLAGDTFHQNRPSLKTQHHFFTQMKRLEEREIPVYLSFGNHDYYDASRYWFDFPENVHLFKEEAVETFFGTSASNEDYAISGFSYRDKWLSDAKVAEFPTRQAKYHIGMYHGEMGSERYAPFTVQEMKQKAYDYWALGHIHVASVLSMEPPIVYPGTPQGHTKKEQETPGVLLVTLSEGTPIFEAHAVQEITWDEVTCSLANVKNQRTALEKILALFTKSEKKLIKVQLTQTDSLPKNWLNPKEKSELLAYLANELAQRNFEQRIYQLEEIGQTIDEKVELQASQLLRDQLFQPYEETEIFQQAIEELLQHTIASKVMDVTDLQQQVLRRSKQELQEEYYWRAENENHSRRD
ncbi:metallophosphoesterase [Enterococcus alcedinis]|uniref:Metallophosphoesterase n=1 Tax=Enterococcus alcedinis TaxID=1274384 RepID=A0A917JIM5_9ENTE|nr:DNA repair exonuclease [Enterococcus alcedinis]MBP2103080.1 DNA repair exonuclease SbcCD nuclease subunit [Enterococcus alcedinis]GGI66642.1 metallophosphoesterase [Enterococcus alcedinis]